MPAKNFRAVFVKKLTHFMSINGKKQSDLIRDLHISSSTVSSWCTGKKLPRMDKIQILADYFHIDKSDLIEEKSPDQQVIFYLNDEEKQFLQRYQRLNAYGRMLLLQRADELIQLGHTQSFDTPEALAAETGASPED